MKLCNSRTDSISLQNLKWSLAKHGLLRHVRGCRGGQKTTLRIPVLDCERIKQTKTPRPIQSQCLVYPDRTMEMFNNSTVKSAKDILPSFLLCNIRSLKHKIDELQTVTQINEVAIVAVTETWLKETVPDSIVFRVIVCIEMTESPMLEV